MYKTSKHTHASISISNSNS